MTGAPWHIRPYRPGDERVLAALWTATFGRRMTEEHWRWKFKTRPSPVENVGIAVSADDRPIFQFGGMPCPALVQGVPRTVMVGADVMTDPEFRRRGVFTKTARRLFDNWREAGVALVLGLANDARWGSRALTLGYERFFGLRWLVRPLRPERLLARRTRLSGLARLRGIGGLWNRVWDRPVPAASDIVVRPLTTATPEIDAVWARRTGHMRNSLVRDRAWVAWRYCDPPHQQYRVRLAERAGAPAGYAVHCIARAPERTFVHVPEVFAPDDPLVLRALVQDVVARAAAEDADAVTALAVPGSGFDRELQHTGFLFRRGTYLLEAILLDPAIPRAAVQDPNSWWLVGGDFDIV